MKKRGSTYVPRNPYAPAAHQRKAGIHQTTEKTKRRDERREFKLELAELKKGGKKLPPFSYAQTTQSIKGF